MNSRSLASRFLRLTGLLPALIPGLLISTSSLAQKPVTVTCEKIILSRGNQPAYILTIPECIPGHAVSAWKDLIRRNTKAKTTEAGGEIVILGTGIREIHSRPFNIYSIINRKTTEIELYAAFELDSVFFSAQDTVKGIQQEKTHNEIRIFLKNFGLSEYRYAVKIQLDKDRQKFDLLKSEYDEMSDRIEKLNKKITSDEQDIRNSEDRITGFRKDNDRKMEQIDSKKAAVSVIKDAELLKEGKKQLRTLEREKRSIEKNITSEQKEIVGFKADIERYKGQIADIQRRQNTRKTELMAQEEVVRRLTAKLEGIR